MYICNQQNVMTVDHENKLKRTNKLDVPFTPSFVFKTERRQVLFTIAHTVLETGNSLFPKSSRL